MRKMKKAVLGGLLAGALLIPLGATSASAATLSGHRTCSSGTVVTIATGSGVIAHAQSRNGVTRSATFDRSTLYRSTFDANFVAAGWAVSGSNLVSGGTGCG